MKHTKQYLQDLHNKTYKPRPQWYLDKITKAYKNSLKDK